MKRTTLLTGLISCIFAISIVPVEAKGKGGDKGKASNSAKGNSTKGNSAKGNSAKSDKVEKQLDKVNKGGKDDKDWRKTAKFVDKDRNNLVSHWDKYKGNDKGLPPGLAKNLRKGKGLPPGWDKKVRNGWKIEDDWWSLMDRVPSTYLPSGMKLPKDTGMFLMGDRMMRVHEPTREVIDFVTLPGVKP
ncbi:hypothetical protein [Haloferula sp.]|uniref:hypothetical protein n=1 Tax=Haloferula sp. TaxID=2497595 RepID=UPI00329F89D3